MPNLSKLKPWHLFLLVSVCVFICNHRWGSTYVGIDNISPFWGIEPIIAQIRHNQDFFTFGPILFSWWFFLFHLLKISGALLSILYVYGYMFLSLLGYYNLSSYLLRKRVSIVAYLVVYWSSLVPLWIFSTHELMFMSAFTALPWVYLWITRKSSDTPSVWVPLLFIPMLLTSAVNLVVFAVSIAFLALLFLVEKNYQLSSIKKLAVIPIVFLCAVQVLIFTTRGNILVTTEFLQHSTYLSQSQDMVSISEDLQKSELQNSSVTNALRFSTGWMSLFDEKQQYLFSWAKIFRTNLLIAGTQLLFIIATIVYAYKNKEQRKWIFLLLGGAILLSPLGLKLLTITPILGSIFRSASTKLWPLIFIPLLLLEISFLQNFIRKKRFLFYVTLLVVLIPFFPWVTRSVYSNNNAPMLPSTYYNFYNSLQERDTVLVIPAPQAKYFRKYTWGYYGSDFVSYQTKAKVIDGTSVSLLSDSYKSIIDAIAKCEITPAVKGYYLAIEAPYSPTDFCKPLTEFRACTTTDTFIYCLPE